MPVASNIMYPLAAKMSSILSFAVPTQSAEHQVFILTASQAARLEGNTMASKPSCAKEVYLSSVDLPFCAVCRGGPKSSEHVDILANVEVMEDVLKIAVGQGEDLEDSIVSRVPEIAANVHCFD